MHEAVKNMHEVVKEYYGKTLGGSDDLKTDACCTTDAMPDYLKAVLAKIHEEVLQRYYGCGTGSPRGGRGAAYSRPGLWRRGEMCTLSPAWWENRAPWLAWT